MVTSYRQFCYPTTIIFFAGLFWVTESFQKNPSPEELPAGLSPPPPGSPSQIYRLPRFVFIWGGDHFLVTGKVETNSPEGVTDHQLPKKIPPSRKSYRLPDRGGAGWGLNPGYRLPVTKKLKKSSRWSYQLPRKDPPPERVTGYQTFGFHRGKGILTLHWPSPSSRGLLVSDFKSPTFFLENTPFLSKNW